MISPPPYRDEELTSQAWQKWFISVFNGFKNVDTEGDIIVDSSSRGIVLKDSSNIYWRVKISTGGALTTTSLGATKPKGI